MNKPVQPEKGETKSETKIAVEDVQDTLYAKREKIYPRRVTGLFAKLKLISLLALLGLYYILPWIQWGERQAVLFDLPARKFYIFGMTFWPQDAIYLAFLLILAGLSLFFFTTLAGRLWCGFACPQTVWTDAFLWMERMIEGERPKRIKLDKEPMSARKFRIKATKHGVWILFSLFTGFTFVGYFTPIQDLSSSLISLTLSPWETFWFLFYGFATYGNAGWMREQVCIYMCPYARFQSAMFDKDTLIVAYDEKRGEPRGSRKRGEDPKQKGLGDCVNCTLCVQVCPTGIDIRDGLQYQCISCSACIDICNEVMDKMGYTRNLISYTTEHNLSGNKTQVLRPRILLYGALLLALIASTAYAITQRNMLLVDILRDRSSLYRENNQGLIENVYIMKVFNRDAQAHEYEINITGIDEVKWQIELPEIKVETGQLVEVPLLIIADPANVKKRSNEITVEIKSKDDSGISTVTETRFLGPIPGL